MAFLTKRQLGHILTGFAGAANQVSTIYRDEQAAKQERQDKLDAEKRSKTEYDRRLEAQTNKEIEGENRRARRAERDRQINEQYQTTKDYTTSRRAMLKAQSDKRTAFNSDPDLRYNAWIGGNYTPKNAKEARYFRNKLDKSGFKGSGADDEDKGAFSNNELLKRWARMEDDQRSNWESFDDFAFKERKSAGLTDQYYSLTGPAIGPPGYQEKTDATAEAKANQQPVQVNYDFPYGYNQAIQDSTAALQTGQAIPEDFIPAAGGPAAMSTRGQAIQPNELVGGGIELGPIVDPENYMEPWQVELSELLTRANQGDSLQAAETMRMNELLQMYWDSLAQEEN